MPQFATHSHLTALGFTGSSNPAQCIEALQELRGKLPPGVALWAGGNVPVLQRRRIDGVQPITDLADMLPAVAAWRASVA